MLKQEDANHEGVGINGDGTQGENVRMWSMFTLRMAERVLTSSFDQAGPGDDADVENDDNDGDVSADDAEGDDDVDGNNVSTDDDDDVDEEPPRKRVCRHQSCHVCDHRAQAEEAEPGRH